MINCKNIIIANFGLETVLFNRYLEAIASTLNSIEGHKDHQLSVVPQEEFTHQVLSHPQNSGFCIAASGVKQCVQLNKTKGIRAAVTHTKYIAKMCRQHNDANVVIIGTDCVGQKLSASLFHTYLESGFDNGERNMLRIQKMKELQGKYLIN